MTIDILSVIATSTDASAFAHTGLTINKKAQSDSALCFVVVLTPVASTADALAFVFFVLHSCDG